jgi:hypothetical protein
LSNFSAQNLLINSHQAHQIAAHPFHHLPMGLPDDNQAHLGIIVALDVMLGSGLKSVISCWQDLALLVQLFSPKSLLTDIKHIRLLLILFTISQWVYQMIIQAHLGIIVALDVMLG